MTASTSQTPRVFGSFAGTAIVAGSMIGVGIFLVPRVVAEQIQSPVLFLLLWLAGGAVALAGAVSYAELGTLFPKSGGDYVFIREVFGGSVAFAGGWLLFLGVFAGSIATMSVAICRFQLPILLEPLGVVGLDDSLLEIAALDVSLTGTSLTAIALVLTVTIINVAGARPSAGTQVVATLVPVLLFGLFAFFALVSAPHPSAAPAVTDAVFVGPPARSLTTSFLAIYFAFAGWNAVAYVGGEMADPSRTIPRSLVGGTALTTLLYVLLCAAFLAVLGMGGLTRAFEAGTSTAVAVIGAGAELWVALLIAVALIGSLNSTVLGGSRIGFAMARDHALPRAISRLSLRTGVPARALWLQAAVACLLIITGTFEQLLALTSIGMLLLGGLAVTALFVLRRTRPDLARPYRATGYPWLPALFLVVSAGVIGGSIWRVVSGLGEGRRWSFDDLFPLVGLAVFLMVLLAHAAWSRVTAR